MFEKKIQIAPAAQSIFKRHSVGNEAPRLIFIFFVSQTAMRRKSIARSQRVKKKNRRPWIYKNAPFSFFMNAPNRIVTALF
jgi:hypothetical protein